MSVSLYSKNGPLFEMINETTIQLTIWTMLESEEDLIRKIDTFTQNLKGGK